MATADNPEIPPSLAAPLAEILTYSGNPYATNTRVSTRRAARLAEETQKPMLLAQDAQYAARWLAEHWTTPFDKAGRSAFYAERYAEIIVGTFAADFWQELSPTSDRTEKCLPAIMPYTGDWNPSYWDENRKPTRSIFGFIDDTYNTPSSPGDPDFPAPGWAGEVQGGFWQDLYLAQQRLRFTLPTEIALTDERPILLKASRTFEASASFRGNRVWFAPVAIPYLYRAIGEGSLPATAVYHHAAEDRHRFPLPDENLSGWTYTTSLTLIRRIVHYAWLPNYSTFNRVQLRISSTPSLGIYYSRNDAATVWHHGPVRLYWPKTP